MYRRRKKNFLLLNIKTYHSKKGKEKKLAYSRKSFFFQQMKNCFSFLNQQIYNHLSNTIKKFTVLKEKFLVFLLLISQMLMNVITTTVAVNQSALINLVHSNVTVKKDCKSIQSVEQNVWVSDGIKWKCDVELFFCFHFLAANCFRKKNNF